MVGDVGNDFRSDDFAVSELHMGFRIVPGGEVDLGGAFVVQGDSTLMIVEAPV